MKQEEIDQIKNLIDEIIANEIRAEKASDKDGLIDHKYVKICADLGRELDKALLEQVTLSKYEISNIFEPYLNYEKINEVTKRILKKCLDNYLVGNST
jgi:uncharacterized protein YggL (DUF469 family)